MVFSILSARYHTRATSRGEVYMNYSAMALPDAPLSMGYYFWIADDGDALIAIDTGFSAAESVQRGRPFERTPAELLEEAGVNPAQVTHLVLTHLHYDHAGNIELFPNAKIIVSQRELDFWLSDTSDRPQFRFLVEQSSLASLRAAHDAGRVQPFDDTLTVAGVTVERVGGHSPGQSIVHIPVEGASVVVASDAAHFAEQVELDALFAFVVDVPESYAALDRLAELRRDETVAGIVFGHDAAPPRPFTPLPGHPQLAAVGTWPHPARQARQD